MDVNFLFGSTILVLLTLAHYSASLQYVPPSREVEVIEFSTYTIGVEEDGDTEIINCYFTSNTGLNHSFPVNKTFFRSERQKNIHPYLFENKIEDLGQEGLCQITVSNVKDWGPTVWTLVAEELDEEGNPQNMTDITYTIHFFYKGPLVEYTIRVQEQASFMNHLKLNFTPTSCTLRYNTTVIELNLQKAITAYSNKLDDVSTRLSGLGQNLCGFKFINTTTTIDALEWSLTAASDHDTLYRGLFKTHINKRQSGNNYLRRREVFMGEEFVLSCGSAPVSQPFCSLYNPAGELVPTDTCLYTIPSFSMNHIGTWVCYAATDDSMESLKFTTELIGKGAQTVKTWVNETNTYVNIGCQMVNKGGSVSYCKMIAPNQEIFNLQSVTATDRYLSIGTNLNTATCSLQIRKPLQEFEKGLWQCEIGLMYQDYPIGGYIDLHMSPSSNYSKHLKLTAQLDEPFTVYCVVPYYTDYCHVQAPNGTIYHSQGENEILLGRCSYTVEATTHTDNGTWICAFARETGEPDDQIFVEVKYSRQVTIAEALSYYRSVEVDAGDPVQLMCSSGGLPLQYCRFIGPNGRAYQIHDHGSSSTISYYGKGLRYGECGITIAKVETTDNGYWTCVTKIAEDTKHGEVSANILVEVMTLMSGSNIAAIGLGTAAGVVVVSTVLGIIAMRKWRRRRHNEDDNISNNSDVNIFATAPLPPSYSGPLSERQQQT